MVKKDGAARLTDRRVTITKRVRKGGRPVTVDGTRRLQVRVSQELYADFERVRQRARLQGRELSQSEALRLFIRALADSPADVLAGIMAGDQVAVVERGQASSRLASDGGRGL